MIREKRSKEKLETYYRKFMEEGVMDANVHPYVAESWQKSRDWKVGSARLEGLPRLGKEEFRLRQGRHQAAIQYVDEYYQTVREFFTNHNLSLLLLDEECYVLRSYAMPFYQISTIDTPGTRLSPKDIGTSSISIAYEHQVPFLLFGPEMWIRECQNSDACSAPVMAGGRMQYILALVAADREPLPYDALVSTVLGLKYALESYLQVQYRLASKNAILDAASFAVYQIHAGVEVTYANRLGQSRLGELGIQAREDEPPNLENVLLNYKHTPIYKGFQGIPSYNKAVTWITNSKTYEDITTIVPMERGEEQDVGSVVALSLPIEDLRTLVAHAVGFSARYNLSSMVGQTVNLTAMKDRAARLARNTYHVMLQGEPGSGKERLAHGMHQASPRAAGPLISVKCGDLPSEVLENELFGFGSPEGDGRPGKLELANGGTLFLDEIEKMPMQVAQRLFAAMQTGVFHRNGETIPRSFDVRLIASCDSDLKRLSERGAFLYELYEVLAKHTIRIPPLRLRREDIPLIASHIIQELAEQHHLPEKTFREDAIEALLNYEWPGNIKQLQVAVEHAFFHTESNEIQPGDIKMVTEPAFGNEWKEDRAVFVKAWQTAGGNISRLANMLDVSRVTLYRYLKKYGLTKSGA